VKSRLWNSVSEFWLVELNCEIEIVKFSFWILIIFNTKTLIIMMWALIDEKLYITFIFHFEEMRVRWHIFYKRDCVVSLYTLLFFALIKIILFYVKYFSNLNLNVAFLKLYTKKEVKFYTIFFIIFLIGNILRKFQVRCSNEDV
jgi:hypothetical protein